MTDERDQQRLDLLVRSLEPYSIDLGLQWEFLFVLESDSSTFPWIHPKPARRTHEITVNVRNLDEAVDSGQNVLPLEQLVPMVHELGHAHLVETRDPIFGNTKTRYSRNRAVREQRQYGSTFYWISNATLDVWVNDVIYNKWPKIILGQIDALSTNVVQRCLDDAKKGDYHLLDEHGPVKLSYLLTERSRRGLPEIDISPLISYWSRQSPQFVEILNALNAHGKSIQHLPADPAEAVRLYESTVNERLRLAEAPVTAQLVKGKWQYEWKLSPTKTQA